MYIASMYIATRNKLYAEGQWLKYFNRIDKLFLQLLILKWPKFKIFYIVYEKIYIIGE